MLMLASVDYCWFLMVATGCCWSPLVAAGCWMIAGCGRDTGGCCGLLLVAASCWVIAGRVWDTACWTIAGCCWIIAGDRVFEYFQEIDDLRLRQFSRRKSLWILPGYWWFAAKTILQAKKSLNISRILMICGSDKFAGEKIFEYFQEIDDLRLRQFSRRKSLWIFPGYWWFAAKALLQAKTSLNISRILMTCG